MLRGFNCGGGRRWTKLGGEMGEVGCRRRSRGWRSGRSTRIGLLPPFHMFAVFLFRRRVAMRAFGCPTSFAVARRPVVGGRGPRPELSASSALAVVSRRAFSMHITCRNTHVHTFMRSCMNACIHAFIHTASQTDKHLCMHPPVHSSIDPSVQSDIQVQAYKRTWTHADKYHHVQAYTYAHTHIQPDTQAYVYIRLLVFRARANI